MYLERYNKLKWCINMEIKEISNLQRKAYSNTSKIKILNELASKLSDVTDLATEIYIGTVSDNNKEFSLYLPINMKESRVYFKSKFQLDLENNLKDKKITITDEGIRNLHFLILEIDKHNKTQNEIFLKMSQIIDL